MKYIRKFNESSNFNKGLMLKEFEDVFGFPLYSLTDRLLEWEDKGFNLSLVVHVWIKVESNTKYNLDDIRLFPDKTSNIYSYANELCVYRTESYKKDDNIEMFKFISIDPKDIVAASIVLFELIPSEVYLNMNSYINKKKEKYFHSEFQELIKSIKRRFDLIEIPESNIDLTTVASIGTIFKRSGD